MVLVLAAVLESLAVGEAEGKNGVRPRRPSLHSKKTATEHFWDRFIALD